MSRTHAKKRSRSARKSYEPKPYQLESIRFGIKRDKAGFFLAPGLGKTSIALFIFNILRRLKVVDTLFVLAKRTICYEVWPVEVKKWAGLEKLRVSVVHGNRDERLRDDRANVFVMNYEGLEWLKENEQRWFFADRKVMLVVDESSKLRNTATIRFKSLKKLLHRFDRRYILTGSPAPNGLMNLFGQVYVLDRGEALGKFITAYRNRYFYPSGFMGTEWKLQPGAEARIFKKLSPFVLRYGADQLKLPPLTFIDRHVKLPNKARALYDKFEEELAVRLQAGDIVAANAAVASGKCRQLANGGVFYTDDGALSASGRKAVRWESVHDAKTENLVDLLEELNGEPALVAFEYRHDKYRIQAYLKKHAPHLADAPFVDGETSAEKLRGYISQWNDGALPVMFAHPETAAHGLNLQGKGGIVVFFSLTWNLENYEQFYQRVWRQGQKRRVLVYRIIASNTVDEDVVAALKHKDATQRRLLQAMEKRHAKITR